MKEILHIGSPVEKTEKVDKSEVLIEFKGVSKQYKNNWALRDVDLKIFDGEFVSMVGQSGAGKTTLIKLLVCQEKPTKGSVYVAGRSLSDLRDKELPYYRRKIGVVFQDFKLLPKKNVRENISFALEVCGISNVEIDRRAEKVIDMVNLGRRMKNYPDELSGGERQRVAIARALIHSPRILIADEPTGNLDPINTFEIIELLSRINQRGTTVLLSTHNRQIVDRVNKRVVLMKGGKVISDQESGKYVI